MRVGGVEFPVLEFDVEDVGERLAVGDHRDAFELNRAIVGIVDDDDRVDRNADGAAGAARGGGFIHAREDHREAHNRGREAHGRGPGAGRQVLICRSNRRIRQPGRLGDARAIEVRHAAGVAVRQDERIAQTLFALEERRIGRRGEIIAVVILRGGAARGVVEVGRGDGLEGRLADGVQILGDHGRSPIAGGEAQRLDAAGDEGLAAGAGGARQGLAAIGGVARDRAGLNLLFVHAVEVAVQVPRRSAGDATGQIFDGRGAVEFRPRVAVDAKRAGPGGVIAAFGIGEFAVSVEER